MTFEPGPDRTRADEARLADQAGRWRSRSRRVQLYRRLLPILIVVLALRAVIDRLGPQQ